MRRRQMFAMQSAGQQVAQSTPPLPIVMTLPANPAACPKCGKIIGQGRYMHVKHCKG